MLKPLLRSSCAFSALFLLSAPVSAQSLADFQQQYRSGDFAAAYKTGAALMAEVGGDVAFEMAFAQSAYAAGKTDDAIFALERVLWIDPTNLAARLLLAEIYAQLGARDLAVEQAGYVLLDTDNDADRDRAQTVLAQMNRPEESPLSLEGAAGVSLGYAETDFATADDTIAATVAGFTDLTASWKVTDGLTLRAGAKATASRLPQDGENNADNVALYASAHWVRGSSGVDIGQSASRTWRSGALQGDALTTSAGYDHTFESGLKLTGGSS
jgi:tetratricopeptide (TPR) repeat protein